MHWHDIYKLAKQTNFDLSHIRCYNDYSKEEIQRLKNAYLSFDDE
jgi:hypothetical protein